MNNVQKHNICIEFNLLLISHWILFWIITFIPKYLSLILQNFHWVYWLSLYFDFVLFSDDKIQRFLYVYLYTNILNNGY
jgi:hypothetical protein